MIELKEGDFVYHASSAEIRKIDLSKGRKGLEFVRGERYGDIK